jgi:hypothetical protein
MYVSHETVLHFPFQREMTNMGVQGEWQNRPDMDRIGLKL